MTRPDATIAAKGGGRTKAKQGTLRKRTAPDVRGGWEARAELGIQPGQRCLACGQSLWLDRGRFKACPTCGGELKDIRKRRQVTKGSFATKKDAQAWLDDVRVARREGKYRPIDAADARLTLAKYAVDIWLPFIETQVKPSTAHSYQMYCTAYILPRLGSTRLQDLSPEAIEAFYHDLLENGRVKEAGGLNPRSVRNCAAVLHAMLDYWVRKRRLQWNAADLAQPPALKAKPEMKSWTMAERRAFLEATKDDRLHGLWVLLSTLGMRRGEALGFKWEDVRFWQEVVRDETGQPKRDDDGHELTVERGSISIRRNRVAVGGRIIEGMPKTGRARVVPLPPSCIAALREQAARQARDAEQWKEAWQDTAYVFTTESGQPIHPQRVSVHFREAVGLAAVPKIRLHDLRHTAATLARQAGVPIEVISQWLGHSSTAMTFNIYSHVLPEMQDDALARVEAALRGR
jgi:integrase